jgi:hypothetical protein
MYFEHTAASESALHAFLKLRKRVASLGERSKTTSLKSSRGKTLVVLVDMFAGFSEF